ncbi:MAG: site-specific DNA-methyltransferase [Acidobacteria bacterium]|nr:site-specific DNA-methyltransferase [Acidobacteriota bacterium]
MSSPSEDQGLGFSDGTTLAEVLGLLAEGAQDEEPVAGWTHNFYRYPARFSPTFVAAAIEHFSSPGQIVLDPYMGGGTVIVESLVRGRKVVGNDLNSLATFITKVKTTPLDDGEIRAAQRWADRLVPKFTYRTKRRGIAAYLDAQGTRNLTLPRARFVKKAIGVALRTIDHLPTRNAQDFARCAVLRVGQWALDGRGQHTPLKDFRKKLQATTHEMLEALISFSKHVKLQGGSAIILNHDASTLDQLSCLGDAKSRPSLVLTSPPYPGVHVLYHRWQVDGRHETPAPYWIAGCVDGQGEAYYTFGCRKQSAADSYFFKSLRTLKAIRRVIRDDGYMIQMVAFNKPEEQLPRYLENMRVAGFVEVRVGALNASSNEARIWRRVPRRKWHAELKGNTNGANEVVLVHRPS